jgi:hypothetical protein
MSSLFGCSLFDALAAQLIPLYLVDSYYDAYFYVFALDLFMGNLWVHDMWMVSCCKRHVFVILLYVGRDPQFDKEIIAK